MVSRECFLALPLSDLAKLSRTNGDNAKSVTKKKECNMTLKEIKKMSTEMRKAKTSLAPTLVFHASEIQNIGKNAGNRETTEDETIQYLKKTVQKLKADPHSNKEELDILESFLPEMASEEDVRAFLDTLPDLTNKGAVMGAVKKKFGTLVDMKMVAGML